MQYLQPHMHRRCFLWVLQAATATLLSGASGCIAIVLWTPEAATGESTLNTVHTISQGTRAAIVASAASCTAVPLWTHMLTAPLASIMSGYLDKLLHCCGVHDASSIVSVHLGGGGIGVMAVGLFAKEVRRGAQTRAVLS